MMETKSHKIPLGSDVQDVYSDFKGAVHGVCFYVNGCVRYDVRPRDLDKDGKIREGYWFDEQSLVVVTAAKTPEQMEMKSTGGPPERSIRQ